MKNAYNSEKTDMFYLGEGKVVPADERLSGINRNAVVIGGTGCGKTKSYVEPALLHLNDSSIVCAISKKEIMKTYAPILKERGYDVYALDLVHPDQSTCCYDPMDQIRNDEDIKEVINAVMESVLPVTSNSDPYWTVSAKNLGFCIAGFEKLNAKADHRLPSMRKVMEMTDELRVKSGVDGSKTTLDIRFEWLEEEFPGNPYSRQWMNEENISSRTFSCTVGTYRSAMETVFSNDVRPLMNPGKSFSFRRLGERKTALFIVTSPLRPATNHFVNLFYTSLFRELFEHAQELPDGHLSIPVHVICDDFACTGRIYNFDNLISIMRGAGISVSLLLQSESQLAGMYGHASARTILNNCDTYLYMGGRDTETCKDVAMKADCMMSTILNMPLEQVIVFRRGEKPTITKRYQIFNDPLYRKLVLHDKDIDDTVEKR